MSIAKRSQLPKRRSILLLEPEPSIQGLVAAILAANDFELVAVTDGDEAVQALKRNQFAAFIVDLTLGPSKLERGSRRGVGFLHYLERTHPSALRRAVVISGLAKLHMPAKMPAVCRFLSKPFGIEELRQAIAACCEVKDS